MEYLTDGQMKSPPYGPWMKERVLKRGSRRQDTRGDGRAMILGGRVFGFEGSYQGRGYHPGGGSIKGANLLNHLVVPPRFSLARTSNRLWSVPKPLAQLIRDRRNGPCGLPEGGPPSFP
jgi:hypothetical protein